MSYSIKLVIKAIVQFLGWGTTIFILWQKFDVKPDLHWGYVVGAIVGVIILAGVTTNALSSRVTDSMLDMPFFGAVLAIFSIVFMSLLFLPFSALWNIKNAIAHSRDKELTSTEKPMRSTKDTKVQQTTVRK